MLSISRLLVSFWNRNSRAQSGTTLGELKKRKTALPLAIVACLCSRHILSQYFDSYLLQVRKKRKVKGCQGEGAVEEDLSKSYQESLSHGGLRQVIPPPTLFLGPTRPGASVQLALRFLVVAGHLSASPHWVPRPSGGPAAVSGVEGGPGNGGGGKEDWKVR